MQEHERLPLEGSEQQQGQISMPEEGVARALVQEPPLTMFRKLIDRQDWMEPVAETLQGAIGRVMGVAGRNVTDVLHGTWLRHPLHVALTDVPIGAWSTAIVLDALELGSKNAKVGPGADAAVAVGVATAIPTALTGLVDWRHVYSYPRRVGLLHALLNSLGLILQIGSLVMRGKGQRRAGITLSSLGYASTLAAAWMGGELVEGQGIGVDHTAFETGPSRFVPVMAEGDLPEGKLHRVEAKGVGVLLFRRGNEIFAIAETCSHQGGPLAKGQLQGDMVVCPWHGSQFRLEDGKLVHGPSTFDQPCFEVRVSGGQIEVRQTAQR